MLKEVSSYGACFSTSVAATCVLVGLPYGIWPLTPRVTADWTAMGGRSGARRGPSRDPAEIATHVLAARERVARAIEAAGPKLGDILLSVCCHLEGLEAAERGFGWPKRSGKLVLQIALDRLAGHYGMEKEKSG